MLPVSLPDVRAYLRIEDSDLDVDLRGAIDAAIADMEAMTSTRLAPQVVEIHADGFRELDRLPVGPVSDIVEIGYEDSAGAAQLLDASVYELFGSGLERGIRPAFGQTWPSLRPVAGAVRVRLAVGYPKLPRHLARALLDVVRARFDGSPIDVFSLIVNDRIWM